MSALAEAAGVTRTKDQPRLELLEALFAGRVANGCRACAIIPARNEEGMLVACLDAFAVQQDLEGCPLVPQSFEVLLLLNNCTDGSTAVARSWQADHPEIALHLAEQELPAVQAHAGMARRLLMDTAWQRLQEKSELCAILSTDADSAVAADWIAQNLRALERGADAVGGLICLRSQDLQRLPAQVRHCYQNDRRYAELVAQLEDRLDPQPGDPWPRHLDHYGSSLACTPQAYASAGGMPAVSPLEDEAFVDRLRRADQQLRHEPAVKVFTSARLEGRALAGLAGQLRLWSELPGEGAHRVQSAEFLAHRFRTLRRLRELFAGAAKMDPAHLSHALGRQWLAGLREALSLPEFLMQMNCDALIDETFVGRREEPIRQAIASLERRTAELEG